MSAPSVLSSPPDAALEAERAERPIYRLAALDRIRKLKGRRGELAVVTVNALRGQGVDERFLVEVVGVALTKTGTAEVLVVTDLEAGVMRALSLATVKSVLSPTLYGLDELVDERLKALRP